MDTSSKIYYKYHKYRQKYRQISGAAINKIITPERSVFITLFIEDWDLSKKRKVYQFLKEGRPLTNNKSFNLINRFLKDCTGFENDFILTTLEKSLLKTITIKSFAGDSYQVTMLIPFTLRDLIDILLVTYPNLNSKYLTFYRVGTDEDDSDEGDDNNNLSLATVFQKDQLLYMIQDEKSLSERKLDSQKYDEEMDHSREIKIAKNRQRLKRKFQYRVRQLIQHQKNKGNVLVICHGRSITVPENISLKQIENGQLIANPKEYQNQDLLKQEGDLNVLLDKYISIDYSPENEPDIIGDANDLASYQTLQTHVFSKVIFMACPTDKVDISNILIILGNNNLLKNNAEIIIITGLDPSLLFGKKYKKNDIRIYVPFSNHYMSFSETKISDLAKERVSMRQPTFTKDYFKQHQDEIYSLYSSRWEKPTELTNPIRVQRSYHKIELQYHGIREKL